MSNKFADLGFEPVETVDAFDSAFERTLGFEGGNTVDHAGPTNLGITQDTYDSWRKKNGLPTKPVKDIDGGEAKELYRKEYFDKPGFSKLPANVASVLFDYGVNAGTPRAAMSLQKAVGASPDGVIGPKTLNKVNEFVSKNGEQPLLQSIVDQRSKHVDSLIQKNPAKYKKYEKGWKNRINAIKAEFKLSDLNPFAVTEASAGEVPQNDFTDLGFEEVATPTETFDDLGFQPEQSIPQLSASKNFDKSVPLPEKMEATPADFDFFTQNLADKLAGASSGQTVPEMIESKNKLSGIIMRAPMLAMAPVAPIASAVVEGLNQAKNLIVSSVKKENYSPIEIRVLNELLPKETPTAVRIAAMGGEALTDVALLGGLSNLAKQGLLKDTIKEIGMKLERAGYGTGQKTINMDVVKEAARGSTLDLEAERWLKAKLGDVKPKNNIGTTTPESPVAGITEPAVAPKTDQQRTVDVNQPEIIKAPPPSKEILAEAQKPATPVERAAQHGEVVGIDAKSGLPVIDTSVKPATPPADIPTAEELAQDKAQSSKSALESATKLRDEAIQSGNQDKADKAQALIEKLSTKPMPDIKAVIEQAGGKFKAITNQENSLYEDEPTIYYDTPSGSTQTIRLSQLNVENVKAKIDKFENIKPVEAAQTTTPNLTPKQTEALAPSTENIVTDPVEVNRIKNSILEGENILKAGKFNGRKLSKGELFSVQRAVNNSKAKIGMGGDLLESKSQEAGQKGNEEKVLIPQGQKVETPKAPVQNTIVDFYKKNIDGTKTGDKIPLEKFDLEPLDNNIVSSVGANSSDLSISSKVLKHIYEQRPKLAEYIFKNINSLHKTDNVFLNVDKVGKKRRENSFILVKKNGNNYATVLEIKVRGDKNEIVSIMTMPEREIKKLEPFRVQVSQVGTTAVSPSGPTEVGSIPSSKGPLPASGFSDLQPDKNIAQQKEDVKAKGDPASLKPPTVSQIKAASSPQEFEKRIEQLNKFGQANAILRRTAKLKNAAGRYNSKDNTVKLDEETVLDNQSYMQVIGHELGHAIEKNVTGKISQGTSGKTGFDLFGKDADHAKIREELIAVSEDLVGRETMLLKQDYYFQSTELIARFFEKMIFSPGNLTDLAPTAVEAIERQSVKQPIIQEFMLAATGGIDKGTPKFALLRDMRETYQKHLGKFVGNRAYDQEMVYRAMKERGKIVIEKFIKDKMKMVKDSPESLFRAAESIKISRGGVPEFGTRDFATAKTPEEEKALVDAGYERLNFTIAEDGKLYAQYAKQRYTPDEAKLIFDSLSDNGKKLIVDFTAERKDAKDFFNREVIKETYKIQSQLEGWVHHYFEDRPGSTVVGGQKFKTKVAGSRKQRTGTEGYVEDFKKAMTKALVDLEGEKVFNEFIPKLLATVTNPLGKGQEPDAGWVEVVGNLKSGVGLPIEKRATVIDSATGERVPMAQSRYQMPKEIYERYKMWRGLIDEATTAVRIVNDLNRYWRINILAHPGTSVTNFVSGGIQFSSKILTDFYREVLTGKLSMPDTKSNISAMLKVLLPKGWMDAPDWVYGSDLSNFYGEFMKKKSPISESIDTYGNKALVLFGAVERYWKKVIMTADGVADLKSLNEMTPEGLRVPTKEEAEMIAAINESVDLYAYDYDNVPQWLEQHQKSVVGQAIKPFAKYPYKYAKQILNMVGEAFDQSKPWQDRVAKLLSLATIVSAYAMFSDDRKKKQKTPVVDKNLDIPPRLSTRGRVFITTDDKGRELFVRVAKYPFFNLTEAGMQFVDGNWSTGTDVLSDMLGSIGPAAAVGLMAFNYRSKYNQYEKPEVILGDNLATFLPGYRILNDVSRALDPFQRKQETFGQTFTQIIPTTDQALQEKLHGKIRTERVPIEGDVGLEPVGSRTTVDVPLENVKEDILLSLFTGVYRTRLDPKVVEAYIIRKQKNLDKKNAKK